MGFGQEIKDFVSGFQAGYKMVEAPTENEKERRDLAKAQKAGEAEAESGVASRRANLPIRNRELDDDTGYSGGGGGGRGSGKNYLDTPVSVDDEGMKAILTMARRDSGANGYNALTYKRGGGAGGTADLTNMTLGQVYSLQRSMPSRGHASTAVGGYQFVHDTLKNAANQLNLPLDTKFTPAVQDMLAAQLVKNRGYDAWKSGKLGDSNFMRNLSREWAILPRDASGRGSYDGYNGNRAGVGFTEFASALKTAKGKDLALRPVKPINPPEDAAYPDEARRGRGITVDVDDYITDEETASYGKGGLVQHFATGGMVEEEDVPLPPNRPAGIRLPSDVPQTAAVQPVAGGADRGRESFREDAGTRGSPVSFSPRDFTSLELTGEAAHDGLMEIQSYFGFDRGVKDPAKLQAFARGEGAANQLEVKEVDRMIDPRNTLTAEERNIARLNAGYKYYRDRGEPLKARQYAASMLMAANDTVRQLGAVAQVALENGDYKGAAKAIAAGKSAVPDGESVRVVGEAGKDGVKFEVFDQDGNVTEQGKASIDQLMHVATGMQNGSLFFEQAGLIKSKTSRERMAEKRLRANEAYERVAPQGEYRDRFIDTLDEQQKAAFLKLNPSDQKAKIAEWERGLTAAERAKLSASKEAATQGRFETTRADRREQQDRQAGFTERRLAGQEKSREQLAERFERRFGYKASKDELDREVAAEKESYRRGAAQEKQAYRIRRDEVLDGRWEQKRQDMLTREEAQLAQKMIEEDNRNRRTEMSLEQRRLRDAQIDLRILNRRAGGAGGGGRTTASERKAAGAASALEQEKSAITNDPAMYGVDANAENPAEGVQGPTPQIAQRLSAAEAGAAYDRAMAERKGKFDARGVPDMDSALAAIGGDKIPDQHKYFYRTIATDVLKGNDVAPDQAMVTAVALIKNRGQGLQFLQDGRVQVDPNLPPVYLSRQALATVAAMMARENPAGAAQPTGIRGPGKSPYLLQDPRAGNFSGR